MQIAIPKETKPFEGRVALIPEACARLIARGHAVFIEKDAGTASGYPDSDYQQVGAEIVNDTAALYQQGELIVKVKEPISSEWGYLESRHTLFGFLHLAANPELANVLIAKGLTAVAYETIERNGLFPILAPMSAIAGKIAVQIGTHLLHGPQGGSGVLLGGVAGTERGVVTVLGAGVAGREAACLAAVMGATVYVLDKNPERLETARTWGHNVNPLYSYERQLESIIPQTDLLIGAVMLAGRRTPRLVNRQMLKAMRSGGVVIDISVDQGGCIETTRPTSYADPVYVEEGLTHFMVSNMPGAVPRTASQALSAHMIGYCERLAEGQLEADTELASGLNLRAGSIIHAGVRESLSGL